jgi:transcriptional antiterminator NusG
MTEPITEPMADEAEDTETVDVADVETVASDVTESAIEAAPEETSVEESTGDQAPAEPEAESEAVAESAGAEPEAADEAADGDTVEVESPAASADDGEPAGAEEARQAARLSREAPQPQDPDADERTTKQWYVIHTYSGYENKVKTNLEHRIESMGVEDQIYQVLVPMEEEIEIRNGQRQTVNKKVFPGYVLVEMIMTDESWYVVRNTPGVTSFVGSGNRPTALREGEVKAILKQMGVEAPKFKVQFQKGQSVRVTDGPFAEFIGTVDEVHPERNKVRVLVSIFGRETPVELDFLQIEKL